MASMTPERIAVGITHNWLGVELRAVKGDVVIVRGQMVAYIRQRIADAFRAACWKSERRVPSRLSIGSRK